MPIARLIGKLATEAEPLALQLVIALLQVVERLVRHAAALIVDVRLLEVVNTAAIHVVSDAADRGKYILAVPETETSAPGQLEVADLRAAQCLVTGADAAGNERRVAWTQELRSDLDCSAKRLGVHLRCVGLGDGN